MSEHDQITGAASTSSTKSEGGCDEDSCTSNASVVSVSSSSSVAQPQPQQQQHSHHHQQQQQQQQSSHLQQQQQQQRIFPSLSSPDASVNEGSPWMRPTPPYHQPWQRESPMGAYPSASPYAQFNGHSMSQQPIPSSLQQRLEGGGAAESHHHSHQHPSQHQHHHEVVPPHSQSNGPSPPYHLSTPPHGSPTVVSPYFQHEQHHPNPHAYAHTHPTPFLGAASPSNGGLGGATSHQTHSMPFSPSPSWNESPDSPMHRKRPGLPTVVRNPDGTTVPLIRKRGRPRKYPLAESYEYVDTPEGRRLVRHDGASYRPRKKVDRFEGLTEDEVALRTLPDHLEHNLDIVIIGINPGLFAAFKGHHYAGPGNHFWRCLYLAGLIPEPLTSVDDFRMTRYGIGFTNIVPRTTRSSAELTRREIKEGADQLMEKLKLFKPKMAVFNGKGIYEIFSGSKNFVFGRQPEPLEGTDIAVFVMPSSSARCAQLPRAVDKLPFYVALRKLRDHLRGDLPDLDPAEVTFPDVKLRVNSSKVDAKETESRLQAALEEDFSESGGVSATRSGTGSIGEYPLVPKRRGRKPKALLLLQQQQLYEQQRQAAFNDFHRRLQAQKQEEGSSDGSGHTAVMQSPLQESSPTVGLDTTPDHHRTTAFTSPLNHHHQQQQHHHSSDSSPSVYTPPAVSSAVSTLTSCTAAATNHHFSYQPPVPTWSSRPATELPNGNYHGHPYAVSSPTAYTPNQPFTSFFDSPHHSSMGIPCAIEVPPISSAAAIIKQECGIPTSDATSFATFGSGVAATWAYPSTYAATDSVGSADYPTWLKHESPEHY